MGGKQLYYCTKFNMYKLCCDVNLYIIAHRKCRFKGELACKNKLRLKSRLAFEKFNSTVVARRNHVLNDPRRRRCVRHDITGGRP